VRAAAFNQQKLLLDGIDDVELAPKLLKIAVDHVERVQKLFLEGVDHVEQAPRLLKTGVDRVGELQKVFLGGGDRVVRILICAFWVPF
jgi:hypothetical protein